MTSGSTIHVRAGYRWIAILLFTCVLSLLTATPARAEDSCETVDDSVIDGLVHPVPPAHIQIARLPEIDHVHVQNPLIAHAVIGRQEQHGCSKERTR
jgi:hypothetical protein